MKKKILLSLLFILAGMALWGGPEVAPQRYYMTINGKRVALPVMLSHPLNQRNEKIETVVLVHHGVGRNAVPSFRSIEEAAAMIPYQTEKTFIISPQFFHPETMKGITLNPSDLYWLDWKGAYGGSSGAPLKVPAYDIIDSMLRDAINPRYFPNVKNIVIVGHSMGSQFTIHYGAANTFEFEEARPRNIKMHYVAMNGAHPVYFTNKRFKNFDTRKFEVPRNPKNPGYNNWGLGLDNIFPEIKLTAEQIKDNFPKRKFFYLAGKDDTVPYGGNEAENVLMGRDTYEVEKLYWAHLLEVFGEEIRKSQTFFEVEGVGHDGFGMIKSKEGLKAIFDYDISKDTVWYVDASAPDGGDGRSWKNALKSLDKAITYAIDGNTIKIAGGTYIPEHPYIFPEGSPDPGDLRANRFIIGKKITLRGGYAGRTSLNPDKRDTEKYETILSGKRDNLYMVVLINHRADAVLEGLTITGGNADSNDFPNGAGGGLAVYDSNAHIENVIFKENRAIYGGGAWSRRSDVVFKDCLFDNNTAIYDGGGAGQKESSVLYSTSIFRNNTANYGGGAVVHAENKGRFTDCLFEGNNAAAKGGGVSVIYKGAEVLLENCIFMGNSGLRAGGGIVIEDAEATIHNSLFTENRSERIGAGISCDNSAEVIINFCTIAANYCEKGPSGFIALGGTEVKLLNSIVWGNTSGHLAPLQANCLVVDGEVRYNVIQFSETLDLGPTNREDDPEFLKQGKGYERYKLSNSSPCIDSAEKSNDVQVDFEQQSRGNRPDIGFDEAG